MAELSPARRRTDTIRQRRVGKSHQIKAEAEKRKHRVETHPAIPVMARRMSMGGVQPKVRHIRNTRRRFDVALPAHGAEMRLPSLPQVRVGWRVISLVMAAFLGFTLYQLWNSPRFRVDAAAVKGLHRITSGEVNAALELTGKPVFTLDAGSLEQQLKDVFPEFSSVAVGIQFPQTVAITVTERLPVLIWKQGGNTNLVDAQGVTFPYRQGKPVDGLPLVEAAGDPPALAATGGITSTQNTPALALLTSKLNYGLPGNSRSRQFLPPEMVSAILMATKQVPKGGSLVYDPAHGLGWKDPRGWEVFMGNDQDMGVKVKIYEALIKQLLATKAKPTLISVEYVHAPYYRAEKPPEQTQ